MIRIHLPESGDKTALSAALRRYLDEAQREQNIAAVEWFIVRHYMRGCRDFVSINYEEGRVQPRYTAPDGGIPFRYEEIVNKTRTEVGRLMRLDIAPAVLRRSVGLDALRRESVAQAILDSVYARLPGEGLKRSFFELLVQYGFAGLLAYERAGDEADPDDPAGNVGIDVIPPQELLLLPAAAKDQTDVSGIARGRWVALEWLRTIRVDGKKLPIPAKNTEEYGKLNVRCVGPGGNPPTDAVSLRGSAEAGTATKQPVRQGAEPPSGADDDVEYVRLQEVWISHPTGRLRRFSIVLGELCVYDREYPNRKDGGVLMPIGWATMGPGLYGRSYPGLTLSLNNELEVAVLNLIRNIQDLDLMGLTGIPRSFGVEESDLETLGRGRRFFWMDKDPSHPDDKIERITPTTTGNLPERIVQVALGLVDRVSQQPEIITQGSAPGRTDSRPALNFLYQASTIPLGVVASSIASAFSATYKAVLGFASRWDNVALNTETMLDTAVIGLKFDPGTGQMSLTDNALPDPLQVAVGIRSEEPNDEQAKKQELLLLRSQGLLSDTQFRIQSRLLNLDYPIGDDAEWQNYRMAVLRNILLFGDGETPGELAQNLQPADSDIPDVHLMVIRRLMASPEFALSSDAVQEAFNTLAGRFTSLRGDMPEQIGHLEEEAAMMGQGGQAAGGRQAGQGDGQVPMGGMGGMGMEDILQTLAASGLSQSPDEG